MYMEREHWRGIVRVRDGLGGMEVLTEKVTFEQRLGKGEGMSRVDSWEKSIVGMSRVVVSSSPLVT